MENESAPLIVVYAVFALGVHVIFLLKRDILFEQRNIRNLLILSLGLFALRYILQGMDIRAKNMPMMQVPFLALLVFYAMSIVYNRIFGKNPKDTFWAMDRALMKDGIFNFLFWVIGLLLPMYLVFEVL